MRCKWIRLTRFGIAWLLGSLPLAHASEIPNLCSPVGPSRVAVILASYDGAPSLTAIPNPTYVRELFLGETHDFSVAGFFKTVSNLRTQFTSIKILGTYHRAMPFMANTSTPGGIYNAMTQWQSDLIEMAKQDQDFTEIDRVVFITPNAIDASGNPIMMGAGMAGQGVCDLDTVNSLGVHHKVAHAWILARPEYQGINLAQVQGTGSLPPAQLERAIRNQIMSDMAPIIHELGHTFGFGHANQVNRPQPNYRNRFMNDEILPGAEDTLYQNSYADPFSAMGSNQIQWLNIAHLSQVKWVEATQVAEVRQDGVYRIYPLELNDQKLKGLRIPRVVNNLNENTDATIWVEYRKPLSVYDSDITGIHHSTDGAIVHYTNPHQPGPNSIWPFETVLLNFHPGGQPVNPYETDLTLTTQWKDEHSQVSLEVLSATPDYLDIKVAFKR
jgi:hypothetical protein